MALHLSAEDLTALDACDAGRARFISFHCYCEATEKHNIADMVYRYPDIHDFAWLVNKIVDTDRRDRFWRDVAIKCVQHKDFKCDVYKLKLVNLLSQHPKDWQPNEKLMLLNELSDEWGFTYINTIPQQHYSLVKFVLLNIAPTEIPVIAKPLLENLFNEDDCYTGLPE